MSAVEDFPELSIRVISDIHQFGELERDWDRICCCVPFRSFQWNYQWWRHFHGNRSLLILAVYEAGHCIGIAPFHIDRTLTHGRVVQFVGSGEVASDQLSILSLPDRSHEVGTVIARWFADGYRPSKAGQPSPCGFDLLQLDGIDAECPTFKAFLEELNQLHFAIHDQSTVHTWRIVLPASMDAYLAMLSKSCRRKVRTALKHFDDSTYSVTTAESEESLEAIWLSLIDLHQRRRQSLGETGRFADATFSRFLLDVAKRFHHMGRLDLICISSAAGPIAAEICFRDCTSSFAYQIGIAPDALGHNPGWLVNTASIRRAIDLGLSSFDLCRGDAEYKRHLGARPTVCKKVRIVPPCFRSQFRNTAIVTGSAVKHFCQDVLNGVPFRS